jgi:hypothetical protein
MNAACPSVPLDQANLLVYTPEELDGLLGRLNLIIKANYKCWVVNIFVDP